MLAASQPARRRRSVWVLLLCWLSEGRAWLSTTSVTTTRPQPVLCAAPTTLEPNRKAVYLKKDLLEAVQRLREAQARDEGTVVVDNDIEGDANATGAPADEVLAVCEKLSHHNLCTNATAFLGDPIEGDRCPLNGTWKLLYTTASDATFCSSGRTAHVQNMIDARRGRITNVIDFANDGRAPIVQQLRTVIGARALSPKRVGLQFRYAKARLLGIPWGPKRRLTVSIPVPATLWTYVVVFFSMLFRRRLKKKVPRPYFDVLFLDKDLRIHKTGEDNVYIQVRETWKEAQPLLL